MGNKNIGLILKEDQSKTILITGGSSGIGLEASLQLISKGHKLIIPCRSKLRSEETYTKIKQKIGSSFFKGNSLRTPVMDLSDLHQINKFVAKLKSEVNVIDVIILNAGLQYTGAKNPQWSKQQYELTFAVNHLSHYYLTKKIIDFLFKSQSPRVIITSSEVHNPRSSGGKIGKPAGLGSLNGLKQGKGFEMIDGSKFSADKAYKDSKLCNILFAKELSKNLSRKNRHIPIIAWAPGLVIPRTRKGFFQYSRKYNEIGQILFAFLARDIFKISTSTLNAGKLLNTLVLSDDVKKGFSFYSNRLISPGKFIFDEEKTSEESNIEYLAEELWKYTEALSLD